jgi:polysaccharide export outer membrane protein
MKFFRAIAFLVLPVYILSCGTQRKVPNYLENIIDTSGTWAYKIPALRIQKNDQLSIRVFSESTNPSVSDAPYNLPMKEGAGVSGFLVDVNGDIEFPRIGKIHVEGMTRQELADYIKNKFSKELNNPIVDVRFLTYKITVLGEVGAPAVLTIAGEKVTILEVMGLAGGITDYGIKTNVRIIREQEGKREIGFIDLTSKDMFESPYYHLMQNDVILVEATKQKAKLADQNLAVQRIGFALSLITAAAFIYNIFK